jgi:pimeloyl-[acyl-carrier protein] methyl ester esterase
MSKPLTCCFLGGWGSTDETWQATLADAALRPTPPFETRFLSWIDCLRDWSATVATLRSLPGRVLLAGWSLGGLLSLRAAQDLATMGQPEKLAAMVLVSATARLCAAEGYDGAAPHMLASMRARIGGDCEMVLRSFARECAAPDGNKEVATAYLAQARSYSPEELAVGLHALAELDLRNRLPAIDIPCRLIHGSSDHIVPIGSARRLVAGLRSASLEILNGCGHALPFTHPAEVAQCIAAVAREVSA